MSRHTPGPWVVRHDDMVCSKEGRIIADCESTSYNMRPAPPIAEDKANAALIAAAPAMYEALSRLRNVASTASNHMRLSGNEEEALLFDNDQRVVEAALAQAEGAQHE